MNDRNQPTPPGVVGIFPDKVGRVVATKEFAIDRIMLWQEWADMWSYAARSNQNDPLLEKQLWRRFFRFQKGCDRWKAIYNALVAEERGCKS